MSTIAKAMILQDLLDVECIEEALNELHVEYVREPGRLNLGEELYITLLPRGTKLNFTDENSIEANKLALDLTRAYKEALERKIERLRIEEIRLKEGEALQQFSEDERRRKALELEKERRKAEAVKRKEETSLRRKIAEKTRLIKEKAMKLGYQITEQVKGKERVMVLVRR